MFVVVKEVHKRPSDHYTVQLRVEPGRVETLLFGTAARGSEWLQGRLWTPPRRLCLTAVLLVQQVGRGGFLMVPS